ncbi:MAG: hypothetical protein ACPGQG_03835 [Candidatus Thalassarchaeaceae archaeon]
MTVRGRIVSMSHLGGLLVKFDGVAPGLGWEVRIEGGRSVGRVDSVIGSVNSGIIHVTLSESIDPASATGAPVEITRSANRKGRVRENRRGGSKTSMVRQAKNRGKRRERSDMALPTWVCKKCRTLNSKTWKCTNCGEGRPERQRSIGNRSSDGSKRPRRQESGRHGGRRASKRERPMSGGSKSKHRSYPPRVRGRGKQGRKPPR